MTPRTWIPLSLFTLGLQAASAQDLSIDWNALAAGGGTSSGGAYSIMGTIGQPAASTVMSGGNYKVTGGFRSLLQGEQTPGAPTLTVVLTSTNTILLSWPASAANWEVQQNEELTSPGWAAVAASVNEIGTNRFIIITPQPGKLFFRLFKPAMAP